MCIAFIFNKFQRNVNQRKQELESLREGLSKIIIEILIQISASNHVSSCNQVVEYTYSGQQT